MSSWSQKAEVVFRVFAREMSDSAPLFEEVVEKVEAFLEPGEVLEIGEISEYFLPCPADKIASFFQSIRVLAPQPVRCKFQLPHTATISVKS